MSNETVIIQQTNLFLNVSGRRITALPDTGTIASMEKITPEAAAVGGLHRTLALVISGSDLYRFTINVMPMSKDDMYLFNAAKAIRTTGKILGATLVYEGTSYVSGSCVLETVPIRNFNADGVETLAFPLIGLFPIAIVTAFVNPQQLTADEILSVNA